MVVTSKEESDGLVEFEILSDDELELLADF
jgi:hypothetical protein